MYKIVFPILNFIVITACVFISLPDAFLSLGTLATFKGNFSLVNMSMDKQLFSAPVSNRALTSLSCTLMGNIVPVSLPNIMLKMFSISLQTHSTKYSFGLYLHSSHLVFTSSSEASVSSVRFEFSLSGNCIPCMRLTSSLHISCPVMVENASAISLAVGLSSFFVCLCVSCLTPSFSFRLGLCCARCLE